MTTVFELHKDIHCQSCAKKVTDAIEAAQPGAGVKIDIGTARVSVETVEDADAIIWAIAQAGYDAKQAS